jgi:hypothetical protein
MTILVFVQFLTTRTVKAMHCDQIDVTDELSPEIASRYMQLIGILRWAVEIGLIDIYLEVSL